MLLLWAKAAGMFAGTGLHVDLKGRGDAHPFGRLPLQQTQVQTAPPHPVSDTANLLIVVVLPGEPRSFQ